MNVLEIIVLVGLVILQASISVRHSFQILRLTKENYQLNARIALLEMEVSGNG